MSLQRRVKMGVGLVEEQDVDRGIGGQRVDAKPLEESTAFNHQIPLRIVGQAFEVPAYVLTLRHLNVDVRVVFLTEWADCELSRERLAEGRLQQFPRIRTAQPSKIRI